MRFKLFLIVALLVGVSAPEALGQAKAVTKRPVTKQEFADMIRANNHADLNTTGDILAASAKQYFGIVADRDSLADMILLMEERPCPPGTHQFANVRADGTIGRVGKARNCRQGETLLYWDNKPFASLNCGNWALDSVGPGSGGVAGNSQIFVQMPERQHVTIDDWPALSVQHYFPEPLTLDNHVSGELTLNIPQLDRITAQLERRKSSAWPWIVGGALVTAAGVGTYCAIKGDCIRIVARSTSSSSLAIKF